MKQIGKVGVIGAGTMGGGIAMNFVNVGIPVRLLEVSDEALGRGLAIIRRNYEASAARGKMTADEVERRMGLLSGTLAYDDLADCDLVIEAAFENLALKQEICGKLGQACKSGAIIATNTSTLDVDLLAEASGRPADFIGMHFFSPANIMRLLEIVRGRRTAPQVLETIRALAGTIGKVGVVSGVCYGFIGNRMLEGYLREAERLLLEGATVQQVDQAMEGFGMAMGPHRMMDLAGVDVGSKVLLEWKKSGGAPDDPAYRLMVQKLHALGRHGQKTGAGYYRYEDRKPVPDEAVVAIAAELAAAHGIARRTGISAEEIVRRCLFPLINEAARILEEGIAESAADIDLVWVNGYGFPAALGGPMHQADALGAAVVVAGLNDFAQRLGNRLGWWTPAPLLVRLAAEGGKFIA